MFDFADKDKVGLFISLCLFIIFFVDLYNCDCQRWIKNIDLIYCVLLYDRICWAIYFDISAIEDKKIGWEEFQIMINPPPPPKAPTPHKVTELGVQLYLQGRSLSITNDL